jgi:hypothetical protein
MRSFLKRLGFGRGKNTRSASVDTSIPSTGQKAPAVRVNLQKELTAAKTKIKELSQQKKILVSSNNTLKTRIAQRDAAIDELSKQYKKAAGKCSLLQSELAKATRFELGSFVPGIAAFREKWTLTPGKRVLFYTPKDYSGSFFKWAEGLHRYSDYAVRMIAYSGHRFQYQTDLLLPNPKLQASDIRAILEETDVIHIKDEQELFLNRGSEEAQLILNSRKPLVFTHYGGYARKFKDDPDYQNFVSGFAGRVAMTPDLCYKWFDGVFIPHSIDTDLYQYSWQDGQTIAHSPSLESRKGTADLLEAISDLPLTIDLIKDVPHQECMVRKHRASFFFDQAGKEREEKLGVGDVIGWYGNSALESAVCGIPTIAHLSEVAFERAAMAGCDISATCKIINTPLGADGIRSTLLQLISMSSNEREILSIATRKWVEDFHSYRVCATRLSQLYDSIR